MKLRPTAVAATSVVPPITVHQFVASQVIDMNKAKKENSMAENTRIMVEMLPKVTVPMLIAEMQKCANSRSGSPGAQLERLLLGEAVKRLVSLGSDLMLAASPKHALRMHRMEVRRQIHAGEIGAREALALADAEHDAFLQSLMYEHEIEGVRFWRHNVTGLSYATMPGDALQGDSLHEFTEVRRKVASQQTLF